MKPYTNFLWYNFGTSWSKIINIKINYNYSYYGVKTR